MTTPASAPPPTVIQNALTDVQLASLRVGGHGWEGAIEALPASWLLGCIVGSPASGKNSLYRCAAYAVKVPPPTTKPFNWPANKAVVSCIFTSPDESIVTLQSCGFASTPSLLRPFGSYSGGERMKAGLARGVLAEQRLFDDFGAAVSNDAAKSVAAGFACLLQQSERIERNEKRVVATSFRDMVPFLQADWVLDLDTNALVVRCHSGPTHDIPRHTKIDIEDNPAPVCR